MPEEEPMCYRAFCKHDRCLAVTVDDSLTTGRCLKDLRDFKKWSVRMDRVSCETFRNSSNFGCDDCVRERNEARRVKRVTPRRRQA
jgi:hypothetical protein